MRIIFLFVTFIAGLLFTLFANGFNSNELQKQSIAGDSPQTKPEFYSLEKVVHEDSIQESIRKKNKIDETLSLTLVIERQFIDKNNKPDIEKIERKYEESYKNLEEVYLNAYDYFCALVISAYYGLMHVSDFSWEITSVSVKLLDDNGMDIIPFINIEDLETKEYKIWIERLEDYKRLTPKHQYIDDFKQPIVEKGKPMYLSFP